MINESMRRVLDRAMTVAVLITLLCVFVPLLPQMPQGPLDPSWAFGMNQSVANGLSFGTDMVFTFGPYASIYTNLYHPATDLLMVLGATYLALSYWFAVILVARGSKTYTVVALYVLLVSLLYSRDALLFSYPLLVALHCYRYADAQDSRGKGLVTLALLFAPFGLLPLIKGSLLVLCGGIGALAVVLFASRSRWAAAAVSMMAGGLSMLLFWMAAGQPVGALPGWFMSMIPIISGYTEAMSINGIGWEIGFYLLASLGLLAFVYRAEHTLPSSRTYVTLVLAAYLFLAFKGGFVRHDLHAMMAGTSLLFAAIFVAMLFHSRMAPALLAMSALVCVGINSNYDEVSVRRAVLNTAATYARAWNGLELRLGESGRLGMEYERALSALRSQVAIPRLPGTADIYSYHQSYLLASGSVWNPRPVLQSYSAYTPSLMEANKAHLLADDAPDHIVFRLETIDRRIPSGEDAASWPILLSRYRPIAADGEFVFLRRQQGKGDVAQEVIGQGTHAIMDRVVLPAGKEPVFARIDLQPSFAGKLVSTFYKPSHVVMRVDLEDGTSRVYRMIPGMVRTGLLVSPLIESTAEFGLLYQNPARLAGKRVKSFAIAPLDSRWQWQRQYDVQFVRYGPDTAMHVPRTGTATR